MSYCQKKEGSDRVSIKQVLNAPLKKFRMSKSTKIEDSERLSIKQIPSWLVKSFTQGQNRKKMRVLVEYQPNKFQAYCLLVKTSNNVKIEKTVGLDHVSINRIPSSPAKKYVEGKHKKRILTKYKWNEFQVYWSKHFTQGFNRKKNEDSDLVPMKWIARQNVKKFHTLSKSKRNWGFCKGINQINFKLTSLKFSHTVKTEKRSILTGYKSIEFQPHQSKNWRMSKLKRKEDSHYVQIKRIPILPVKLHQNVKIEKKGGFPLRINQTNSNPTSHKIE